MSIDSSKELKEIYDGMIEDGTGLYDVIKIIGEAFYYTEQLESENARLRKSIQEAIAHQEIVGGSMAKMSTTVRILRNALEEK